ncbi:MAG: heparinase II/III family protein [Opitutaceae bacterium]
MSPRDSSAFHRLAPGRFGLTFRSPPDTVMRIEVTFGIPSCYLNPFFRYACRTDPSTPFTFPHFRFNPGPPGRRVGPWPGWRGIPNLPGIRLKSGGILVPGSFFFLGDEEATGVLRAIFTLEAALGDATILVVDDDRILPEAIRWFPGGTSRASHHPVALRPELIGQHPRLLLGRDDLDSIRRRRLGHGFHFQHLVDLLADADRPFEVTPESKALPGPERLSPEDHLLIHALMALVDPAENTLKTARKTLRQHLRMASRPDYPPMGIDTQSGESLFIACLAFDWLHNNLPETEQRAARRALRKMAEICRHHLGPERRDYGQAHYLGCGLGLLTYAFLMWETDPEAAAWAAELRGAFDRVLDMLPPDGAYPHGINLWIYEYGFILRWLEVIRHCTGENLWSVNPHFARASRFRAATTSADNLHGITFGDPQFRVSGDSWCHFLIAARTGSTAAQALGNQLIDNPHAGIDHRHIPPRRRVYEYLWHEPKQKAAKLADGLHVFRDTGQVFLRRSGRLLTLRSGPLLGRQRRSGGEWGGYGHSDPCQGAFLLWSDEHFVASGPGPVYRRDTAMHNAITIDGRGQAGDGGVWAPDFLPPEFIPENPEVVTGKDKITIRMDLTPTYLRHLGVIRHIRTLHIDDRMTIVGRDEVKLRRARRIGWHFHSWCPVRIIRKRDKPEFTLGSLARIVFRRSTGTVLSNRPEDFVPAYPHDGRRGREITVRRYAAQTVFNWQLDWL